MWVTFATTTHLTNSLSFPLSPEKTAEESNETHHSFKVQAMPSSPADAVYYSDGARILPFSSTRHLTSILNDFSYSKAICIPIPKCSYFGRGPNSSFLGVLISNVFFTILLSQKPCASQRKVSYSCNIYFTTYSNHLLSFKEIVPLCFL